MDERLEVLGKRWITPMENGWFDARVLRVARSVAC